MHKNIEVQQTKNLITRTLEEMKLTNDNCHTNVMSTNSKIQTSQSPLQKL